ncbi:MAG: hypothetical protein ABIJ86_03940 [Spirochaetota bacterium]
MLEEKTPKSKSLVVSLILGNFRCLTQNSAGANDFGDIEGKGMMRLCFYIGWHNYHKRFRTNNPAADLSPHAEHAGIPKLPLEKFREVAYRCRAFLSRFDPTLCDAEAWLKQMPIPLKAGPEHLPKFAWAEDYGELGMLTEFEPPRISIWVSGNTRSEPVVTCTSGREGWVREG